MHRIKTLVSIISLVSASSVFAQSGALVKAAVGGQTINTGTYTKMSFDTVIYDNLGFFDPSQPTRLTIPKGVKRAKFVFSVETAFSTQPYAIQIGARKNGQNGIMEAGLGMVVSGATHNPRTMGSTAWIPVVEGDYFEMAVAAGQNTWNSDYTWFAVEFESE